VTPNPLRPHARRPRLPITGALPPAAAIPGLDLDVPREALPPLLRYLDRMLEENTKLNLTGITERAGALTLHVLDSLHVWAVTPHEPELIVELGSGNGFPGVAAACLWPQARTVLVERTRKKADAIARCLKDVELGRVEVVALDAAQVPSLRPDLSARADLVLARALGPLAEAIELAAPILRRHGSQLVQWKAAEVPGAERAAAAQAARRWHLRPREDHVYELPGTEVRQRRLVLFGRE